MVDALYRSDSKLLHWTPAIVFTVIAVGILAAGFGIVIWREGMLNPAPAIPKAAVPHSAPIPHDHCDPRPAGRAVPAHHISVPPRDIRNLHLALQEFAHRQDGCYYNFRNGYHRLTLPETTIREIRRLNYQNYPDWAADQSDMPASSGSGTDHHRQIDLLITAEVSISPWITATGVTLALVGTLACVFAMIVCVETARTRPGKTPTENNLSPATGSQPQRP